MNWEYMNEQMEIAQISSGEEYQPKNSDSSSKDHDVICATFQALQIEHDPGEDYAPTTSVLLLEPHIPLSYREAINGPDAQFWIPAI